MNPVLKKLQIKAGATLAVHGAPPDLEPLVGSWSEDVTLTAQLSAADAYLVFVRSCAEIARLAPEVATKAEGDAIVWFAYPKKSSRRYASDVGRDASWAPLGALGFEGVRQIAIDDDWSALRFRRVAFIRTLARDPKLAMSTDGKTRAQGSAQADVGDPARRGRQRMTLPGSAAPEIFSVNNASAADRIDTAILARWLAKAQAIRRDKANNRLKGRLERLK
ncbi:MAG: hypothetical protein ACK4GM_13090 [Tabrizicola sp.]